MRNRNIKLRKDYISIDYPTSYKYLKKILAERAGQKIRAKVYQILDNHEMEYGDTLHLTYDLIAKREWE